jgi:tRNA(Ile)-lysidine synthase
MAATVEMRPPVAVLSKFSQNLNDKRPLGIAVSGGSDSLGLLLGLTRVIAPRRLVALTVDHGLRSDSADEARFVKSVCRGLGVCHETLIWSGEKPDAGLQAQARAARYGLLGRAAGKLGLAAVVTGHTSDDQRETLAMRRSRGLRETAPGLAGIPPASLFDGRMWVLRPLLGVKRADIRRFLYAAGANWLEDPSNRDERFERVRVRAALHSGQVAPDSPGECRRAAARINLARNAAAFIEAGCQSSANGVVRVRLMDDYPEETVLTALEALINTCGGAARSLDRRGKSALDAFVRGGTDASALTVGRMLLRRKGSTLSLRRERRGLDHLTVAADETAIWDGRYRIRNLDRRAELTVIADGAPGALPLFSRDWGAKSRSWSLNDGVAGGFLAERQFGRYSRVLPVYELPLAQSIARMDGSSPFPACPWDAALAIEADMT